MAKQNEPFEISKAFHFVFGVLQLKSLFKTMHCDKTDVEKLRERKKRKITLKPCFDASTNAASNRDVSSFNRLAQRLRY